MLKIIYGREHNEHVIKATSNYFNQHYKEGWFLDDFIKQIMYDIDSITVENKKLYNKIGDEISPKNLSSGVKVLILIYFNTSKIFDISACGDNCAKWLIELGKRREATINLSHIMPFNGTFKMEVVNNHKLIHNNQEFLDAILPYIGQ